jgi:hypothetical protein
MSSPLNIERERDIARLGNILVKTNELLSLIEDAAALSEQMSDIYIQLANDITNVRNDISDKIHELKN